jgi:hypothetical protein
MRLKLICFALVGLLVVAATGCGSKKKSAKTTTTTAMTTTSSSTTSASGGTALTSTDCAKLAAASQTVSKAFSGTVPSDLNTQVARLQALAKVAPAAIKGDFETLATAAGQVVKLGLKPGVPPTAAQLQAITSLDITGLTKAAQNIGAWAQANCTK